MNWSESIKAAIDYIEDNLTNDITINDISNYDVSLYLDFNIIITNLDLVDDEQKKILVSNIKSKILELKELLNERQSHRQHIPNVGKQMFKQQLALVETLEKWIIDFENSLKGQN